MFDEVLAVLEERQVPYVVILTHWVKWKTDPIARYVKAHYERVKLSFQGRPFRAFTLFRRREEGKS